MSLHLVIGATRSGKSAHAERVAAGLGRPVRYVATADPADASMAQRIAAHRARRPAGWETVVAGEDLAGALAIDGVTLLDGLGVWIAGALHRGDGAAAVRAEVAALRGAARDPRRTVVVVAEQAGAGLLPLDRVARDWLDVLGEATLVLSGAADRVDLVVAGRVLSLPAPGPGVDSQSTRRRSDRPVDPLRTHGDALLAPGLADHAVNVLAGGPPEWLRPVLRDAAEHAAAAYPDDADAVTAIAEHHHRDPAEVVVTNGAAEALWLLPAALRPSHAVCVHPGFTEAEAALRAHGIPVTRVLRRPDEDFALVPERIPADADLVVVGHPASPSATLDPRGAIEALRRPGRTVVVDEAFMSMVPGEPGSLARGPDRAADVVVVRSLTKLLAVPGLRVGYALAPPPLADRLRAVRPPWSANAVALAAIAAALRHPAELRAAAARASAEGSDLNRRLAAVPGVRVWPSATNFSLLEVVRPPGGAALVAGLRDRGFAVRHAAGFPGLDDRHVRVTARAPDENAALVAALSELLA